MLCILTLIICTDGQCAAALRRISISIEDASNFDVSVIADLPIIFSKSISSIRNIFTTSLPAVLPDAR